MESSPIKDILYDAINQITESRIQQEISKKRYGKIIADIFNRCEPKISKLSGDSYEIFGTLAESMLHYLLTNALIPSQRKISIENTEIDIVIPDSRTLVSSPKDALILYFVKTSNQGMVAEHLAELLKIQPVKDNIWVVSKSKINSNHKTYEIKNEPPNFGAILDDINDFLLTKPQAKFRIFKT